MSQQPREPSGPPSQRTPPGDPGHQTWSRGGERAAEPPPGWRPAPPQPSGPPGYRLPDPGAQRPPRAGTAPLSQADENLWALLTHLSVPFLGFVGPLVVHLLLSERSAWLRENVLEALNFSLLYTLVVTASGVLTVLLIGFALLPVAFVAALVPAVLAAVAAHRHELYRYPVSWRLVR